MKSKLKKAFEGQVQRLADQAQDIIYHHMEHQFFGSTYVEGVADALNWVLGGGEERETPLSRAKNDPNRVGKPELETALKTVISAFVESQDGDGTALAHLAANEKWFKYACKLVGIKPEELREPKAV